MRDYFRSRFTMQLPSAVDNFRQNMLHHNTSFIAFCMNDLKTIHCLWDNGFVLNRMGL